MKPTDKQLQYIKKICEIRGEQMPNIETKEQAQEWLSREAPKFSKEVRNALYSEDEEKFRNLFLSCFWGD